MKAYYLTGGFTLLVLAGCAGTQPTTPVIQYENTIVAVPDQYAKDCKVSAPPNIQKYLSANRDKQEAMLIAANKQQIENIRACNLLKKEERGWIADTLKLYASAPNTTFVGQQPPAPASGVKAVP